ncbi:polyprenyl synthetase family protein [Marinoscillum sp. MHG1-6]|uniref:polyprenyl synthetase family protein n=1 Tax=Marinoscillum sp. MHG1-6 TaxID=2959627 RepID=UPI00215743AB|nr:polyprenyl synthetase family protein [Marinoscillum sp. MHG1-6]
MKSIPELQELIRQEIDQLHFGERPKDLYDPISYIMSLGGKRMRPLLVLMAYQLKHKDVEAVISPAVAVEVFHNFTLMHDDIMDEAPLRRGKPTVHEKWNRNVAILSGDTMLVKAYDLLLNIPNEVLPEALRLFNRCAVEVCEGQQIDMDFETQDTVQVEEYLNMIRLKTAVLLGFSLELGALLAGFEEADRKRICDFGVSMGLGFQLMDDLLDVYGDQSKFGKQVGGDIVSNKKTYLLIRALEQANGIQKQELESWLGKEDYVVAEKVDAVRSIYDQLDIKGQTTEKMNQYFDQAFRILDGLDAEPDGKSQLKTFASSLINRES